LLQIQDIETLDWGWQLINVIQSTKFWSIMINKDMSVNLHQNCLILYSKILLCVLHNMSLIFLLLRKHTGFQTSLITFYIDICLVFMIQQAYRYVRASTWPCLMFFKLKITKVLKSVWRVLEKSGWPCKHKF